MLSSAIFALLSLSLAVSQNETGMQNFSAKLTAENGSFREHKELECPTWFLPVVKNNSTWCECRDTIIQDGAVLRCPKVSKIMMNSEGNQYDRGELNVSILTSFCMTHNFTKKQTIFALCPYNFHQPNLDFFLTLPSNISELNTFMCGVAHRQGELCNRCVNSKGPDISVVKSRCFEINKSTAYWILYFTQVAIIPTIFFFIVLFCKFRTTTGPLNAFILFSQGASVVISTHRQGTLIALGIFDKKIYSKSAATSARAALVEGVAIFYNFWNNQWLGAIDFAVSPKISSFQVLALGYASALYPLLLILLCVVIIWLHYHGCKVLMGTWKLFHWCTSRLRIKYDPTSSMVHTFATFILLIYTRILNVSFSLLAPTKIYNQSGELDYMVMEYDSSIHFMSREHMPYVILSLSVLTVFCGLPLLFLFLYPMTCFQRLLNKMPVFFAEVLREFGKAYTGCYRDKTDPKGTDCRYFASLYFLLRVVYFACLYFMGGSHYWLGLIMAPLIISILFAAFQPYRRWWLNVVDSAAFALITLITVFYAYNIYIARISLWIPATLLMVPLLYIVLFATVHAVIKMRSWCSRLPADDHCTHEEENHTAETAPLLDPLHTLQLR